MNKGPEEIFSQRRYTFQWSIGKQVHEKVLNVTNHQGNANSNHSEISPHTSQNDYHQ